MLDLSCLGPEEAHPSPQSGRDVVLPIRGFTKTGLV